MQSLYRPYQVLIIYFTCNNVDVFLVDTCNSSCINSPSISSTTTVLTFNGEQNYLQFLKLSSKLALDTTTTPFYYYTSLIISSWQDKTTSVSTATPSVSDTPSISDTSDSVIALGVSLGVLLILTTISVITNIYCFIKYCKYPIDRNRNEGMKRSFSAAKQTKLVLFYLLTNTMHDRTDDDIPLQVCEPYELCKAKRVEVIEEIYDECEALPNMADEDYI